MTISRALTVVFAAVGLFLGCASASAWTADFSVTCENGRNYSLRTRAVSDEGDLVTGHLMLAPRRSVHVRLIPMGVGYRYAGKGVWLDGIREAAVLNFSNSHQIACTVLPVGVTAVRALN
jgi:hypothetical protein